MPSNLRTIFLFTVALWLAGCSSCGTDNNEPSDMGGGDVTNNANNPDMGGDGGGNNTTDMDPPTTDEVVVSCANTWTPPATGLCETSAGSGDTVLLQVGSVLGADAVYENGTVLISGTGGDATISCVGCDCAAEAQGATVVTCAEGTLSPSLINPHDHITFDLSWPQGHGDERFEHRHDWRRGIRGHSEVNVSPGGDNSREAVLFGELRMLLGGATSIAGSSSSTDASGLLRNLDNLDDLEGLTGVDVDYRTFPLGDSNATLQATGCDYPNVDDPTRAANAGIYLPHVAEGIDEEAANEFRCLSSPDGGGVDLVRQNTSIIHGIGLTVTDIAGMAAEGAKLVWSPRSNIDLYGNTARVTTFDAFGVTIALGTDWTASGSMNVLRELKCADFLNSNYYNNTFSNRDLWLMSTYNAAVAMGADNQIGVIREGHVADLALFDGSVGETFRAVIDAGAADVHLVLRGGAPLYGDANVIEALVPGGEVDQCETLDVCGSDRRVCVERDAGITIATLRNSIDQNAYPLFFCDEPDREPSCVPSRPNEYSGVSGSDTDGDGIADADDICPAVFTPTRPMDGMMQNDFDVDTIGDDCDLCPLSEGDMCAMLDPDDRDADGVPNLEDNCPADPNAGQENSDGDPYGDVCDPCPDFDNTASTACPATIYEIRQGAFGSGDSVAIAEVIVTAVSDQSFFVQVDPSASYYNGLANSGLYVFAGSGNLPALGDIISVEGRLDVFGDLLELTGISNLVVASSGNQLPAFTEVSTAEIATGGARASELEATLVRVRDVTVTNANPDAPDDYNEFEVEGLRVDDLLYLVEPDPMIGDEFAILQGALVFSFGNSKLVPRGPEDVVTGPPGLSALEPSTVFARAGTTGSSVPPLEVVLSGPSLGVTTVLLAYTGNVSGPATLMIPDGQARGEVPITAAGVGNGNVTATLNAVNETSSVTVYDDGAVRTVASLTPATSTLAVNGTQMMTVNLNVPAPTGGQVVNLAYGGGVSGPATLSIPQDTLSRPFTVTAGANPGNATVTASIGGSMQVANITLNAGSPNCLIISEYIEGSGSNNKAFELYNCSGNALPLQEFSVCLVSNANTTCTAVASLPVQSLPVGDVFTICRTTSGAAGDPVDDIVNNCNLESGSVANFNGNDRLVVFRDANNNNQLDATDEVVDAFGELAVDPGSVWSNTTYRRCDFTQYDGTTAFDVATLYTSHAENDATDFGTAPVEGCP